MTLSYLHTLLGWLVIVANGIAGGWAVTAHWIMSLQTKSLLITNATAHAMTAAQVILGVVLVNQGARPAPGLHQAYGFLALISIAIIYSYRSQISSWRYLLLGFGSLWIMGLGIRAALLPVAG